MSKYPVKITETLLRDAHQSLLATRLRTQDMLRIAQQLDKAGYWAMEVIVGATFESSMRYLGEDPWERLRLIREAMPATKLMMLLRGQTIAGHKHYPDDIIEKFIMVSRRNGIDIFRIFDALNDIRNMEFTMKIAKREGAHVQGTICYTVSPVHTNTYFADIAKSLKNSGSDSICIKDLAGLLTPYAAFELIQVVKKESGLPVFLQTQYTSGMGTATLLKAVEAGVDGIDTAFSSMSHSTTQPPTESLVAILRDTERDSGLNLQILSDIAHEMSDIRRRYNYYEAGLSAVDMNVIQYQVPGAMLAGLVTQLKQQGQIDKYYDVLEEIPKVRADLGFPPLVTPLSQMIATQSIMNVVLRERYKVMTEEIRQYVRGHFGQPPGPVNKDLQKKVLDGAKPIDCRPADLLSPGWESAKKEIGDLASGDEDVVTYALYPQVTRPFLSRKAKGSLGKEEIIAAMAAMVFQQHDYKSKQGKRPERSGPVVTPWKIAGRTHLGRR